MAETRKKLLWPLATLLLIPLCLVTGKSESPFRFVYFPLIALLSMHLTPGIIILTGISYTILFILLVCIPPVASSTFPRLIIEIIGMLVCGFMAGKIAGILDEERKRSENAIATFHSLSNEMKYRTMNLQTTLEALSEAHTRLKLYDREKDSFMATVSHELRTPLSSIRAYSEILLNYADIDNETRQEFTKIINLESERLTAMINEILDLRRLEVGGMVLNISPVDVSELINNSIRLLTPMATEKGLQIIVKLPTEVPVVAGDMGQLTQVFINLINNAIKFTSQGQITVGARVCDDMCELFVKDTGEGIYPEEQELIFKEFYRIADSSQTRPHGSGLGLSISKKIVEYHGGQIWIDSSPGKGSTFFLTIPLYTIITTVGHENHFLSETVSSSTSGSTMILSESTPIRQALRKKLEELGHRTLGAGTPRHAIMLCCDSKPDLIISDVVDQWEDFLELTQWACAANVRMILSSFILNAMTGELCLALNGYLYKPFDWFAIMNTIERIRQPAARFFIVSPDNQEARSLQAILASKGLNTDLFAEEKEVLLACRQSPPDAIVIGSYTRTRREDLMTLVHTTPITKDIPLFLILKSDCGKNVVTVTITKETTKEDISKIDPLIKEVEHAISSI